MITILSFNYSEAQTSPMENTAVIKNEFNFPPLNVVIDSVLKQSAMLSFRNSNILAKESALATERIYWTKNLGLQADYKYGNMNNSLANGDDDDDSRVLTTTKQFTYSTGVYLKVPLFDGLNRKNQIQLAKSEVEGAKAMADAQKEEIRQRVILLYQDLLLKQKILQIRSRSLGDARVNMQMVEKEFRNGVVPISEYVRISGMTTNMEAAYETAISEFVTAKKILEDMAGFVFGLTLSN